MPEEDQSRPVEDSKDVAEIKTGREPYIPNQEDHQESRANPHAQLVGLSRWSYGDCTQ